MLEKTAIDPNWRGLHREQHARILTGKRNWWPTPDVSERFAYEFERAVEQRGDQAREAFKRFEGWKHARHH